MRMCIAILSVSFLCGPSTQEVSQKALVAKKADEIGKAMMSGDYAKVIDLTLPKAVEMLGGRDKAIEKAQQAMKQMERDGVRLLSVEAGEPGEFVMADKTTYIVVPTTTIMTMPGGKMLLKGYLVGISIDQNKTWHFADGAGLDNPNMRAMIVPNLPANLKLPTVGPPEFIKDKTNL